MGSENDLAVVELTALQDHQPGKIRGSAGTSGSSHVILNMSLDRINQNCEADTKGKK